MFSQFKCIFPLTHSLFHTALIQIRYSQELLLKTTVSQLQQCLAQLIQPSREHIPNSWITLVWTLSGTEWEGAWAGAGPSQGKVASLSIPGLSPGVVRLMLAYRDHPAFPYPPV